MQQIFLLGKNGMLGRAIAQEMTRTVTSYYELKAFGRGDLDITNKNAVFAKITQFNPTVVINATGYTNVDGAETEKKAAFAVNAVGVGYLVEACAEIGAIFFHFSTDYIFDGIVQDGYMEDDTTHIGPLNTYGKSKLEGEFKIQNSKFKIQNKEWKRFIIRTSWLYGPGGKNFVDTLLTRAQGGQTEFKVVNDQFGKPTYTKDLAQQVVWMVEHKDELASGVYHCANEITNYPPARRARAGELRITKKI